MSQEETCCCGQPKGTHRPAECSPEKIRECHGDVAVHPCEEPDHPCQCDECCEETPANKS